MSDDHNTAPILVVEDPDLQDLVCRALRAQGFAAAPATMRQVRDALERRRVDLVITNSLEILPAGRARVLYLGAAPSTQSTARSLPKPFKLDQLVAAVRELLAAAGELILVVDDQPDDRALIKIMLERLGHRVAEAGSGREALEVVERSPSPPSLAVLDVVMPEMGGPELAEELRARWPSLPILFVSSYAENAALRPAMLRDIPYIGKPFTYQKLAAKVQALLTNRIARCAGSPLLE